MNAVLSKKSVLLVRLFLTSAASFCALQSPGCSGTVVNSHNSKSEDGGIDPSSSTGGSGNSPSQSTGGVRVPGTNTDPGGPLCGNGVIDPGESCDGSNLGGATCYSATMGVMPNGPLYCSSCTYNVSSCYGNGVGGVTGGPPIGGGGMIGVPVGPGGSGGMMGVDPVAVCYANGGVPDPANPNNCYSGPEATKVCEGSYVSNRLSASEPLGVGNCASGCGCASCASQYDKCAHSYDCMYLLECAERMNCSRMVDCYQPNACQSEIDAMGGQRGRAAIDLSNVLGCMSSSGCMISCNVDVGMPTPMQP